MIECQIEQRTQFGSSMQVAAAARGLRRLGLRSFAREIYEKSMTRKETPVNGAIYSAVTGRDLPEGISIKFLRYPAFWNQSEDIDLVGQSEGPDETGLLRLTVKRFEMAILCEAYRLGESPQLNYSSRYVNRITDERLAPHRSEGRIGYLIRQQAREELIKWNRLLRGAKSNVRPLDDIWPSRAKRDRYIRAVGSVASGWFAAVREYVCKARDCFDLGLGEQSWDEFYLHPYRALMGKTCSIKYWMLAQEALKLMGLSERRREGWR